MTDEEPTVAYLGLDHHHCGPYLASLAVLPVTVTCAFDPNETIDIPDIEGVSIHHRYGDLDRLFAEQSPDIVWITASNLDTPRLVGRAVGTGADAFVEKPMACTAAGLEPVVRHVREAGALVVPSYPWRAHPIAQALRRRAAAGFFGDLESVSARFFAAGIRHRDAGHYLYDAASSRGGIVQWLGVHWLDLVPWMLDEEIVAVAARMRQGSTVDVDTHAVVAFELTDGTTGTLECGYTLDAGRYETGIDIRGRAGRASWDPMGETFGFDGTTAVTLTSEADAWASAPRRRRVYEYAAGPGYGGRWGLRFMEQFLDALTGSVGPPATIEDARAVLTVLDAVYESADTGRWTSVR